MNPYERKFDLFVDKCALEGIDVIVIRENADYYVVDLEGDIYDYRDVEWCILDSGGRTIDFQLFEDGYASLTIAF